MQFYLIFQDLLFKKAFLFFLTTEPRRIIILDCLKHNISRHTATDILMVPRIITQATQTHPECQLCLAGDLYVRHDAVLVLVQAVEQGGVAAVLVEVRPANLRIIGWSLILSKKIDFLAKWKEGPRPHLIIICQCRKLKRDIILSLKKSLIDDLVW